MAMTAQCKADHDSASGCEVQDDSNVRQPGPSHQTTQCATVWDFSTHGRSDGKLWQGRITSMLICRQIFQKTASSAYCALGWTTYLVSNNQRAQNQATIFPPPAKWPYPQHQLCCPPSGRVPIHPKHRNYVKVTQLTEDVRKQTFQRWETAK
jgi:hypothetical protein